MNRIFYGWYIVLGMVLVLLVEGGTGFYIFGIFYAPLGAEFGWDRSAVAMGITLYVFMMAVTAPLVGIVTDKIGAKKVIAAGALVGGAAFLLLSRINTLWQFYACYALLGLAFSACGVIPVNAMISNWFENKRGLAIGIATAGVSLGAIILTNVGGYILNTLGWRSTYLALSAITGILILPYLFLIVKDRPEDIGLTPCRETVAHDPALPPVGSAGNNPGDWPFVDAVRDTSFWLLLTAYFFVFISISAVLQFEVDYLLENGFSKVMAASVLGLTGGAGGLGKILFGYLADKTTPKTGAVISLTLQVLGIFLLITVSPTLIWIFAVVYGFSMGAQLALQPLLIGQFYGTAAFGKLLGILAPAGSAGIAVGPLLAGHLRDAGLAYAWIFTGGIGCVLIALTAILFTRPSCHCEARNDAAIPDTLAKSSHK